MRTSGCRRRSGSSWRSASAAAFGQIYPWLKGSSASPRMETTLLPSTSTATPQAASQRVQVTKCRVTSAEVLGVKVPNAQMPDR